MKSNLPASDQIVVAASAPPRNGQTAFQTPWLKADQAHEYLAVIQTGTISATGTLNAKLEQATDDQGAGAKDITGKTITQLGPDDSQDIALIDFKPGDLDEANGFEYVRLFITPAVANGAAGGLILAVNPRYGPASEIHSDKVAQIVS